MQEEKPRPRRSRRSDSFPSREQRYLLYREAWRANHPNATPKEYSDAMTRIARELKV